jgi:hypothetical protein
MRRFPGSGRFARLATVLLTLARIGVGSDVQSDGVAILKARCFGCHNSTTAQGKLNLTSRETAFRGGERGPAIIAGKSRDSLVYQLASQQVRPFMPLRVSAFRPKR